MSIHYQLPLPIVVSLAFDALTGGKRSFREDALACIEKLNPPLHVLGKESIPASGLCVVTVNHYYRSGFRAEWIALAGGTAAVIERVPDLPAAA